MAAGTGPGSGLNVRGQCDRRFSAVAAAFEANLVEGGETGAAVAVSVGGRRVVDLCGGTVDHAGRQPWAPDTLVNVFSVGKAFTAMLVWRQVEAGLLDPDQPIAMVWPTFATAGKDEVTLRNVLAHQAGLPAVRERLAPGAMLDHDVMATALAAQEPWWEPGTAHGYHVNTFGVLLGEVLRRVTGATVGALLRRQVAAPLGADVHLGLPPSLDRRVAPIGWGDLGPTEETPPGLEGLDLMRFNAYSNPAGLSGFGVVDTQAWRRAELPGTNLHASARGIADGYAGLLDGRMLGAATLAEATTIHADGPDLVLGRPSRFGAGFQLTAPERPLGPNPSAFGHFGAGGSLGFADPDASVAFGFVTRALTSGWRNPRNAALVDAVYASLG